MSGRGKGRKRKASQDASPHTTSRSTRSSLAVLGEAADDRVIDLLLDRLEDRRASRLLSEQASSSRRQAQQPVQENEMRPRGGPEEHSGHGTGREDAELDGDMEDDRVDELLNPDGGAFQPILPESKCTNYDTHISDHVSERVKKHIWEGGFVEMRSLLPGQAQRQDDVKINVHAGGRSSTTVLIDQKRQQNDLNIENWTSAFMIYTDIYCQKFPLELRGLLAYMARIRDYSQTAGTRAFNFYDATFRQHKVTRNLPWISTHTEVWTRMINMTLPKHSQSQSHQERSNPNSERNKQTRKFCHQYNNKGICQRQTCKFDHACSNCGKANHPQFKCFKLLNATQGTGSGATGSNNSSNQTGKPQKQQSFREKAAHTN